MQQNDRLSSGPQCRSCMSPFVHERTRIATATTAQARDNGPWTIATRSNSYAKTSATYSRWDLSGTFDLLGSRSSRLTQFGAKERTAGRFIKGALEGRRDRCEVP
jgi:hypothetical protein